MLKKPVGGARVSDFPEKKRYEDVRFKVISVTRGWVGIKFPEKKRYVTLEWPHTGLCIPQASVDHINVYDNEHDMHPECINGPQ